MGTLSVFVILSPSSSPLVNCSDPATPGNGFIEPHQNTTEGAEIYFRCNSQFVPSTTMISTCGADGRWNPDPATHMCTCECPPMVYTLAYIYISVFVSKFVACNPPAMVYLLTTFHNYT